MTCAYGTEKGCVFALFCIWFWVDEGGDKTELLDYIAGNQVDI